MEVGVDGADGEDGAFAGLECDFDGVDGAFKPEEDEEDLDLSLDRDRLFLRPLAVDANDETEPFKVTSPSTPYPSSPPSPACLLLAISVAIESPNLRETSPSSPYPPSL